MKHLLIALTAVAWGVFPASASAQDLPDGPGRTILQAKCSKCHGPEVATTFRHSAEDWQDVIATMNDQGATVTDEEIPVLVEYLTKNWGPRSSSAPSVAVGNTPSASAAQSSPPPSTEMPAEYKQVLDTLGKQGDFKDGVLKVNIPRNDLKVAVDGVATPTPFGFGGWVALERGTNGMNVMMGDLVLTEDEVGPVMSALLNNGFEVTALHNHFLKETPRIAYMHVHGHGSPADLATNLKPVLALIGTGTSATSGASTGRSLDGSLNTARLATLIGTPGESSGNVYKITIGRPDIALQEMGAPINARMGLNTWAAFYGTDADAVVAGDVAMLENEVQPVLKALRTNGITVVAIHQHMIGTTPTVYFLHYWGRGPAEKLAAGVRAAVDQAGKPTR